MPSSRHTWRSDANTMPNVPYHVDMCMGMHGVRSALVAMMPSAGAEFQREARRSVATAAERAQPLEVFIVRPAVVYDHSERNGTGPSIDSLPLHGVGTRRASRLGRLVDCRRASSAE